MNGTSLKTSTSSVEALDIYVCPVCGHFNPVSSTGQAAVGSARCAECRLSLAGTEPVSRQEAEEGARRRRAALRRRGLLRYGLVGLVAVVVVGWIAYVNLDPFSTLAPPTSTIGAVPGPGEWAMFRRDPAHTGGDAGAGTAPTGEVAWRFESDAPIRSSPAVVDGRVYVGTGDHRVVALDAETGEIVWEHEATGPVDSSVAVAHVNVFVGLRDARVLALDAETGDVRWEYRASGPIHGSPVVDRGELYVGSDDFGIYALDAMTGEERWVYKTGGRVTSSPAVNADVVAVTSEDKYLYVIDRSTGRPRLDFQLTTGSGSPVLTDSYALAIDGLGRLTAIDWREDDKPFEKIVTRVGLQLFAWGILDEVPNQRGFAWSFLPPFDKLVGEPAVTGSQLKAGHVNVYVSGSSGTLYALDLATGRPVWEFHAESGLERSPSVWGQLKDFAELSRGAGHVNVYIADSGGRLYAVDADTGEPRWVLDIGGSATASPVVAGGGLYVVSMDGGLLAMWTPHQEE